MAVSVVYHAPVHPNPYGRYVEHIDVLAALEETPRRIDALVRTWSRALDERSYADGKWSARQILVHLVHMELIFSTRLRFALAQDGYVIQPFEQDDWMANEPPIPALAALEAYVALREMNVALLRELTPAERARHLEHPDYGTITVDWIMAWIAGHDRHHLPHFMAIAGLQG